MVPPFTVSHAYASYQHGNLDLEKEGGAKVTQLVLDYSTVTFQQYLNKTAYRAGEPIYVYGQLRNTGTGSVYVSYLGPPTSSVLKDQSGSLADSFGGAYVLEGGPYGNATLQPNTTMTLLVWDFPRNVTGGGPWSLRAEPANLTADDPGTYYVRSVTEFSYGPDSAHEHGKTTLWSAPLWITILPRDIQNTSSTVPQNATGYATVNSCDKKIGNKRDAILNSIDKKQAILLAENDKDFAGLVGDSKYIAGEPSVEGSIDYSNCSLVDPTIEIQFNVLTPNSNIASCPYVIAIEDASASRVLAVDLGSCSALSALVPNPLDASQTSAVIWIGGAAGLAAVGLSVFVLVKKK